MTTAEQAEPLLLANQFGESVDVRQLPRPSILVFFPHAFSPVCDGELSEIQAHLTDFYSAGVDVYGISTDSKFTLRAYAESVGIQFPLLSDHWPHGSAAIHFEAFNARTGAAQRRSVAVNTDHQVVDSVLVEPSQSRPWCWYEGILNRSQVFSKTVE